MNDPFARVRLLMQHQRFADAEREARGILAQEPDDHLSHALLALCLVHREAWQEATREAESAIHLAPDDAFGHYALAHVLFARNRHADALQAVTEAIRLDPHHEGQWALSSRIHFAEQRWEEALAAAERGLEIDADDVTCNNLRTLALEKLGRAEFAQSSAAETLRRAPDDPTTHAVQGWTLLSSGDHRQAKEHLREALRLDPNNEFARQGMIAALNSHNPIFRVVFRFYVWIGRLSGKAQWAVILGALFGQRILKLLAREIPALQPYIFPLLFAYFAFVMLTWIANPLFNTFLRFNRYGRFLLDRDQTWASNFIAAIGGAGAAWLIAFSLLGNFWGGLLGALFALLLLIPVSAIFNCDWGWPRFTMIGLTVALGVTGGAGVLLLTFAPPAGEALFGLFALGIFLSQFAAHYLVSVSPQK